LHEAVRQGTDLLCESATSRYSRRKISTDDELSGLRTLQYWVRSIVSAPGTTEAVLGGVVGLLCRAFRRWNALRWAKATNDYDALHSSQRPELHGIDDKAKTDTANLPLLLLAGAIASLVAAAFLSRSPTILDRVLQVDTPVLKVQLATSTAERQLILNFERDLVPIDGLEDFPRSFRFIHYDCAQAAGNAHLTLNEFQRDYKEDFETFKNGIVFRAMLLPYFNYLVNARERNIPLEILQERARSVVSKLTLLLSEPSNVVENLKTARQEIDNQMKDFGDKYSGIGVTGDLPVAEQLRLQSESDPDPHWCDPPNGKSQFSKSELLRLIDTTRYVHGVISLLYNLLAIRKEISG
jgi:hypothetical protein